MSKIPYSIVVSLIYAMVENPSSDVLLWQSFDHPIDVILRGAKYGRNNVTGLNRMGISQRRA
jgi:hypothetical protein